MKPTGLGLTPLALLLSGLLALAPPAAVAEDPEPVAVPAKPDPSDFFHYERRRVTTKDGVEKLGAPSEETLHRFELGDDGLYLPVMPRRQDLAAMLAFRFVRDGTLTWKLPLHDVADVAVQAKFRSEPSDGGGSVVTSEWTFASKGRSDEPWTLRDGRASARLAIGDDGIVRTARVTVTYEIVKKDPRKDEEATKPADETWEYKLVAARAPRYQGFYEDVNAAIDRGVVRLRQQVKDDGSFEPHGDWLAGTTALGLYTLLACGVPRDDPQVEKAFAFLLAQQPTRTYELSIGLMACERAWVEPGNDVSEAKAGAGMPEAMRAWCVRAAGLLESQSPSPGSFGYPNGGRELYRDDSSNTQYGALGLRAAARLGIPVKEATWLGLIRHFERCRERDAPKAQLVIVGERGSKASSTSAVLPVKEAAGFKYRSHMPAAHGSMTCAGIASLAIARDELRRAKSRRLSAADEASIDTMIAGGWAWLDRHWSVDRNPQKDAYDWYLYWLYSLERAGVLTDVRLVNGKDWYFDGSMELLARQEGDGSWTEGSGERTTPTCFALLFLKRATAPAAATTGR